MIIINNFNLNMLLLEENLIKKIFIKRERKAGFDSNKKYSIIFTSHNTDS